MNLYDRAKFMDLSVRGHDVRICVAKVPQSKGEDLAQREGEPQRRMLLIHGNPGHMASWEPCVGPLSQYGEVAAFDLPGFGRSGDAPAWALRLTPLADAVAAVLDGLGWSDPCHIIGHSHGGAVAQLVATRHAERVASVTLLATLGYPVRWSYKLLQLPGLKEALYLGGHLMSVGLLRPWTTATMATWMTPLFLPEGLPGGVVREEMARMAARPGILLNMARLTAGAPWEELLENAPKLRAPTLFVHGGAEMLVPVAQARAIYDVVAAHNSDARFVVLPDAGHMIPLFHGPRVASLMAESFDW